MTTSRRGVILGHLLGASLLALFGWLSLSLFGRDVVQALEASGWVIGAPQYLWGLCLIPLLLVLRAYSLSDLPRGQQVASFLLRAGVGTPSYRIKLDCMISASNSAMVPTFMFI